MFNYKRFTQLAVILLVAAGLKEYYSTATPDQLRWILAPTTVLVELATGRSFTFESHAGYMSDDRSFMIAASCAGVNFLITCFLLLSLRRLWKDRARNIPWRFIPCAAACAYLATLVANTVRISTALQRKSLEISWLSPDQLHRLEGIFIYFGFLLLLYAVSDRSSRKAARRFQPASPFRQFLAPVLIYYATTLGIPLVNGAYRQGADFWEHALFVLVIPLILIVSIATLRLPLKSLRFAPQDSAAQRSLKAVLSPRWVGDV